MIQVGVSYSLILNNGFPLVRSTHGMEYCITVALDPEHFCRPIYHISSQGGVKIFTVLNFFFKRTQIQPTLRYESVEGFDGGCNFSYKELLDNIQVDYDYNWQSQLVGTKPFNTHTHGKL